MQPLNRRQLLQHSTLGLAAVGGGALTLHAEAAPTEATEDVHDYQAFLDSNGIPQVQPAGTYKPTHVDILGPFHLAGAPFRGKVTAPLEPGETMLIRGRIWGFDSRKPIANALLDVWQADVEGRYDMSDPRKPPQRSGFRNRIRLLADETGYYEYETIRPGSYRAGGGVRPAHIHYMVQAAGYKKLITQLYFKGDPNIQSDPWASKSNLLVDPVKIKAHDGSYQRGTFDIVLAKA
jgi:protocatechuate 3,4-dioxygenase beta subunit